MTLSIKLKRRSHWIIGFHQVYFHSRSWWKTLLIANKPLLVPLNPSFSIYLLQYLVNQLESRLVRKFFLSKTWILIQLPTYWSSQLFLNDCCLGTRNIGGSKSAWMVKRTRRDQVYNAMIKRDQILHPQKVKMGTFFPLRVASSEIHPPIELAK